MRSSRSRDVDDDDEPAPAKSSNTLLWVLLFSGLGLFGLFACCGCGGVVTYLIIRDDITGTTWRGTETLPGFGPLTFEFKKNGVAIMRDARDTVQGTWVRNGSEVTIRFANCEYRGTINGKTLTGTANGAGVLMGRVWQFSVTRD
jgi:hypothetical protein